MKKVLFIKDGLKTGGTTSSFIAMINALSKQNKYAIYVWINNYEESKDYKLPENIHLYENKYIEKTFLTSSNRIKKIWDVIKTGRLLLYLQAKMLQKADRSNREIIELYQKMDIRKAKGLKPVALTEFDLIVSWEEFFSCYFLSETVTCKRKIAWIHPDYQQCGFNPEIDRSSFHKLDAIVAVSETGKDNLRVSFPELENKLWGISNCINVEILKEKAKVKQNEIVASNKMIFVTVGRLQNISKAYDRAVEIAYKLKNENYEFTWYFIGDGEDREILEQRILELGLNENVRLLGSKDNPYSYMAAADLFILQSYYEGKPMVVDEAMIVGTPVLVTDYASASEQVETQYGWIVHNNEDEILSALKRIIENPSCLQEKKLNLAKMDVTKYSEVDEYLRLFDEVLNNDCENF